VFDQQRTGYLEDVSLRPDLKIPQPVNGEPIVSMLAAPLIVRGKPIGTLEIYGRQRKSWSDDQIALAESLAAQAAISLENAELFAEIEAERLRLRTVLDTVPFGVAICDGDCKRLVVNPAGRRDAAHPAEHADRPAGDRRALERVPRRRAADAPASRRSCAQSSRASTSRARSWKSSSPTGGRIFVLASAAPIRDASEKIVGGVAAWADITVLKTLQRELDLRRREAEEASVRKSRFLAAASHDIRTPANAISLIAELIKRTADNPKMAGRDPRAGAGDARQRHVAGQPRHQRARRDALRDGQARAAESEFPLAALLEEEVRQTLPLAQAKGFGVGAPGAARVAVAVDRPREARPHHGQPAGNAIKFTDAGAVRVGRAARKPAAPRSGDRHGDRHQAEDQERSSTSSSSSSTPAQQGLGAGPGDLQAAGAGVGRDAVGLRAWSARAARSRSRSHPPASPAAKSPPAPRPPSAV
jgi:PAS domain-containing protein